MDKNDKNSDSGELPENLTVQRHAAAFNAVETISCEKCGRKSPASRSECFYCRASFDSGEKRLDPVKANLRKPESWENGFNLIYRPAPMELGGDEVGKISRLLDIKTEFLEKLIETGEVLPAARLESASAAEIIRDRLLQMDFETEIVSDEKLNLKHPARRLRKIGFEDGKINLTLFNTGERIEIPREDLCLIASGSIFEKKVETTEKYVKSKENKFLGAEETAKDDKIIDIYTRRDANGYRVLTSGFDFSALEREMSLLAFENMKKMFEKLRGFAPEAKAFANYDRLRHLLGEVWEIEEIKDSSAFEKKGIGNFNLKKATVITNLPQFTRYSRLLRHLI